MDIAVKIIMNNQELEIYIGSIAEELEKVLDVLSRADSIPRDIENALRERLQIISSSGTAGSATTQNIGLTGNPQTITVPAQPSGTIAITVGGVTYNVLYK